MAVDAYVQHSLPGRLRLRVPAAKGEEHELQEISSAIAKTEGIDQVEYNPITGSILIRYSAERYNNLRALESGLSASAAPIALNNSHPRHDGKQGPRYERGRSIAAKRVNALFKQLDHEIRVASHNEVDLKFILPFGAAVLGLLALRYSSITPLWLTLMIFAFNAFLGLHAPTPEDLQWAAELE
jgi:hypothetical protein